MNKKFILIGAAIASILIMVDVGLFYSIKEKNENKSSNEIVEEVNEDSDEMKAVKKYIKELTQENGENFDVDAIWYNHYGYFTDELLFVVTYEDREYSVSLDRDLNLISIEERKDDDSVSSGDLE